MNVKIRNFICLVKEYLFKNLDIIYTVFIITIKSINYNRLISVGFFDGSSIFLPIFSSVAVVCSISLLFKPKVRIKFLYVFNVIISILLIADSAYYRYFKDCISLSVIRNGVLLSGVSSSLKDLVKPYDFIYILDCIILIPIIKISKYSSNNSLIKIRIIKFTLVLIIFLFADASEIYKLSIDQPNLISTMFNKVYIVKVVGVLNFQTLDSYNVISTKLSNMKSISPEKQAEIKKYLDIKDSMTSTSNFNGIGKGKNLIMIQVEALQNFVINQKVNGQEITPNLNRWINKSLYFNNYFYQVAAGVTSDAEFLSNNSLYPASSGAAYYIYGNNNYDSLAKQMNHSGYYSAAINGYKESFWNRNVMYKAEDFNDYYSEHNYNINETVGLGLSDKSFFNQTIQISQKLKQPYFSFLITLSSHYPYDDQKGYGSFDTGKYNGTFLGNYLNGIHYTDEQIGMFLDKLEKEGVLDNSIVVLYGDHYAIPKNEIEQVYEFENINNLSNLEWYELQKVPMLIHFPHDENKGINSIYGGEIDLYPTLANLFGLQKKYMFGSDLLNTQKNTVIFRNGSFTDGNYFYVSFEDKYYDIQKKLQISASPELKTMKQNALTELEYSDDILNHNLLKSFLADENKKTGKNKR